MKAWLLTLYLIRDSMEHFESSREPSWRKNDAFSFESKTTLTTLTGVYWSTLKTVVLIALLTGLNLIEEPTVGGLCTVRWLTSCLPQWACFLHGKTRLHLWNLYKLARTRLRPPTLCRWIQSLADCVFSLLLCHRFQLDYHFLMSSILYNVPESLRSWNTFGTLEVAQNFWRVGTIRPPECLWSSLDWDWNLSTLSWEKNDFLNQLGGLCKNRLWYAKLQGWKTSLV